MNTKYSVVKNTLTKIAAKNAGVEIDENLLAGPSAIAFIKGDPIDAAKSFKNFQKENPLLIIKGGIYEGKPISTAELMKLADLESREVLLAKLAGAMKGNMAKAARIFDALRLKLEAGTPVQATEAAAPIAEPIAEPVAASEPETTTAEAEVPAVAETTEAVAVTEEPTETPAE
jgi:large subunit ribosomal protein L10